MNKVLKAAFHSKEQALDYLFPRVCPVCQEILTEKNTAGIASGNPFICADCYRKISFPSGSRCMKCSRPLQEENAEYCSDCAGSIRCFDRGLALMMHDEAARKILYGLKYYNRRDNADMPAYEAALSFEDKVSRWKPDVIIPVPLHRKRKFQRGFNQSELLAERFSRYLSERGIQIPVDADYLIRTRQTIAQKELDRLQRMQNIKNAFGINPSLEDFVSYRSVLLVDDIYTSGITLSECAAALKRNGVERVYFITFSIG